MSWKQWLVGQASRAIIPDGSCDLSLNIGPRGNADCIASATVELARNLSRTQYKLASWIFRGIAHLLRQMRHYALGNAA